MSEILVLGALSILFGFSMKLADLVDEHGLHLFKYSGILLGFVWGSLGATIIYHFDVTVSMFWLATTITYIVKSQIDYFNHGVATAIILISFFINYNSIANNWDYFYYFFFTISTVGLVNKYFIETGKLKLSKTLDFFVKLRLHYTLIVVAFSIYTGVWFVTLSRILFWIAYEIASELGEIVIKKQKAVAISS